VDIFNESKDEFLQRLLEVIERVANTGELQSLSALMDMTDDRRSSPLCSSLAEAFAKMVVKLEAREFQLECTIDELTKAKNELELANYDSLTGLPNRVIAVDRLNQGMAVTRRTSQRLALMYLDLDRFKWVNDNLGHAAGDELLQQVAQRLRECVREVDTVARLGGDEFLGVMSGIIDEAAVCMVAERIVIALARPFALSAGEASIGVSIGISLFPDHSESGTMLISYADKALYKAKNAGRNGYCVYSAD
jgi:diguanylate cyclase (GGDEF)-like protein